MFPPTRSEMPRYPQFSEKWAVFFLSERFFFFFSRWDGLLEYVPIPNHSKHKVGYNE